MTNPTPVAWMYSDDNRGGTGVISFDRISHYKNEVAIFTEAQLNQARADALREAAKKLAHECDCGCPCDCYGPSTARFQLLALADEIDGEKK